jgi:hypothetical protein
MVVHQFGKHLLLFYMIKVNSLTTPVVDLAELTEASLNQHLVTHYMDGGISFN